MIEKEYLLLEQTARQSHLALTDDCVERGGNSTNHRGVLAQYLDTPIYGRPIDLCHACHNDKCSNPQHLYWGSRKENVADSIANGTYCGVRQATINKYGLEKANEMTRRGDKAAGGSAGKGKKLSKEHKRKISEATLGRKRGPYKKK